MNELIIIVLWALVAVVGIVIAWQGAQEKIDQQRIHREWINKYGRSNG